MKVEKTILKAIQTIKSYVFVLCETLCILLCETLWYNALIIKHKVAQSSYKESLRFLSYNFKHISPSLSTSFFPSFHFSITPFIHHSNTPLILKLITYEEHNHY